MEELIYSLITDNHGTLRYATSHMTDRGLFETPPDGFPIMTAYSHVEQALEKTEMVGRVDDTMMQMLIVEELTRLDQKSKVGIANLTMYHLSIEQDNKFMIYIFSSIL